ncbi:MAG: aspartate dehydrogenase [Solirubrobacteraceae bacterium]
MSDVRAVGIVGAGTIGRAVGARLQEGLPGLKLLGYVVRAPKGDLDAREFASVGDLLDAGAQIVVEAASHDALRECGEPALAAGADLVCTSVGALADPGLRSRLWAAGVASGARLVVPSGAVGALDVLGAAAEDGLDEVVIEQRKPPRTLLPADEADALTEPRVVFDGTVTEVVSLYPKTTNVAAAVALAGLGFDATRARVVADPSLRANQALLTARGSFGELALRLDNVATANPRTSAITAQSVVAALRRLVAPLVVPG